MELVQSYLRGGIADVLHSLVNRAARAEDGGLTRRTADTDDLSAPLIDYDSLPAYADRIRDLPPEAAKEALDLFLPRFKVYSYKAALRGSFNYLRRLNRKAHSDALEAKLHTHGACAVRMSASDKEKLLDLAQPMIEVVEAKIAAKPAHSRKFSDNNTIREATDMPRLAAHLNDMLARLGLASAMRSYVGHKLNPISLAIQINEAENTEYLYYARFASTKLKPGKASYLHVDSNLNSPLKVLIYLSDVDEQSGPFRYVMGSPRSADPTDLLIRKTTDLLGPELTLERFLALPAQYRRRTHFGFELPDDHPSTDRLLAHEHAFLPDEGDLLCFDVNGIHRGGMVTRGRRIILQANFK
jgi:hypothetical protein